MEVKCIKIEYSTGQPPDEKWYLGDKLHRDNDLPAVIHYYPDGDIRHREWRRFGLLYRHNKPAIIAGSGSGQMELWYINSRTFTSQNACDRYITSVENSLVECFDCVFDEMSLVNVIFDYLI